jgi:hypothetical protein
VEGTGWHGDRGAGAAPAAWMMRLEEVRPVASSRASVWQQRQGRAPAQEARGGGGCDAGAKEESVARGACGGRRSEGRRRCGGGG